MTLALNNLSILLTLTALFSLMIGSFLNVVIARYPIMLENEWKKTCQDYLNLAVDNSATFNLNTPRSHCPNCRCPIKWYHNIPIISYLLLRARCSACKTAISPIYPLVEALTCLLSLFVVIYFLWSWQAAAGLVLTWLLITLSFIDFKTQLLPDSMTLSGLWLGLFINIFFVFTTPPQAIAGALIGYLLPWTTATLFKWIRKKDGMGHGDFKLLAMLGAWFGVSAILNIIFIAVFFALITTLLLCVVKKIKPQEAIPFGPFIAIAGWLTMMTGPILINYLLLQ